MYGKLIVLGSVVLFGCRGAALHAQTSGPGERGTVGIAVAEVPPLPLDAKEVRAGGCAARALGSGNRATRRSMERVPISWRSTETVFSAWRLEADSKLGPGSIVFSDRPDAGGGYYLGHGIFAGCDQSTLSSAFENLAPKSEASEPDPLQLG
jgi:hypothetical protein